MYLVFFKCRREDEKIVKIVCHEVIHVVVEDVVNVVLESTKGVTEIKRHDCVFIEAIVSVESCFPFFTEGHVKSMVSITYVTFREVLGVMKAVK